MLSSVVKRVQASVNVGNCPEALVNVFNERVTPSKELSDRNVCFVRVLKSVRASVSVGKRPEASVNVVNGQVVLSREVSEGNG